MKTIIFDVDDTLYDQLSPFKQAIATHLDGFIAEEDILPLYLSSRKYSDEVFEKHMSGEITALDLQIYRIMNACADFQIPLTKEDAISFQQTYYNKQQEIQLFPEVEELFHFLYEKKFQLAILTNGEDAHQARKIKQLQLEKWIPTQHIFVSGAIGYSKPDPRVFQHIEDRLAISKEETIYIGDSYENDIVGAKQVGWKAIWFNHRQREIEGKTVDADYTIHKASDLLSIFI
ncbi:HAD family hydrolase [Gracilibacillus marinus]|uniref:HAD family hydrolase n=1 Tax=Gracilibacillus marinus TaxID=630535 RepID=A0ABV8VQG5_9BACI